MLKTFVKRCIASLLIVTICGGIICPTTNIYANTTITSSMTAFTETVSGYYPTTTFNVADAELIKIKYNNTTEYFLWANTIATTSMIGNYQWTTNSGSLNGDANSFSTVLSKIDDSLGVDVTSANIMSALNNLSSSQGASNADLSNINQRMAAFLYMRLNPTLFKGSGNSYKWESVESIDDSDYADMLNTTLSLGYSESLSYKMYKAGLCASDQLLRIDGLSINSNWYGSINNLGVVAIDTMTSTSNGGAFPTDIDASQGNRAYSVNNKVFIANEIAIYTCLEEYLDFYLDSMPQIANSAGWEENSTYKAQLTYIKTFAEAFGDMIPFIAKLYTKVNSNANGMSLQDMVNKSGASSSSLQDAFDVDISTYTAHTDNSSPVTQFYTINASTGIISYDRDAILADIDVDTTQDGILQDSQESQRYDTATSGDEDAYQIVNTFLGEQADTAQKILNDFAVINDETAQVNDQNRAINDIMDIFATGGEGNIILKVFEEYYGNTWTTSFEQAMRLNNTASVMQLLNDQDKLKQLQAIVDGMSSDLTEYLANNTTSIAQLNTVLEGVTILDHGVSAEGQSTSYTSVTINDYIIQGMALSATFIPMRTNLYAPETIATFKDDDSADSFYNFYIDYGFMRKALLIDTSATAATDYYNSNGLSTGSLKVCTLRDLIESGDNDVVLYIDSEFYNAEDAINQGTTLLSAARDNRVNLCLSLQEFTPIWKNASFWTNNSSVVVSTVSDTTLKNSLLSLMTVDAEDDKKYKFDIDELRTTYRKSLLDTYKFDIDKFDTEADMQDYADNLEYANSMSTQVAVDNQMLKTNGYTTYNSSVRAILAEVDDSDYVNLASDSDSTFEGIFHIDWTDDDYNTDDNPDTIVMTSAQINQYLSGEMTYSETVRDEANGTETITKYTADTGYTPLMSLAWVSCLYRNANTYTLANTVESNNPVFMASDDLCGISGANQWYRNSLLNYALLKNLSGNAQVDISYVTDLDCPVYMDVFGNILTESGTVVIPAACNATLHVGSFKEYDYAVGLYSCYGKEYTVPSDLNGALSVLYPYFTVDENAGEYVINGITMNVGSTSVRFDKIDTYSDDTKEAVENAYKAAISSGSSTRLNWIAIVKIINEVMRGAPLESIDKEAEGLYVNQTKSGLMAAAKYESLLDSLSANVSNTLLCIPDFSRMDNLEVWVALLIKLMMVATAAVIIIAIYRDGVSGQLGLRTVFTSLMAIALTVSCIVVVPAVFQLTYYSANKFLLGDEAMRILMVNEEKRQGGMEIGITQTNTVESNGEFALQLDWIKVPWYNELETMLYDSTLDNLQETKLEAYKTSAIYNNSDVTMYNDGAYITTDDLFDSVSIDFTFNSTSSQKGLYLYANDSQQTASFYSPYYAFLKILVANVNEYNRWLNNGGNSYSSEDDALAAEELGTSGILGSYNYTVKYMSSNRPKTVGLCEAYFESDDFMLYDEDIMRLCQIYGSIESDTNPAMDAIDSHESGFNRALLFDDSDLTQFRVSYWYNNDLVSCSQDYYNTIGNTDSTTQSEKQAAYLASYLDDFYTRVSAMDSYARDFIANNKDMLGKVSDETFLKVMALNMAIKYNQLFGVPSANSLEIYNMNSEDLVRLCIVKSDEAVMATSMSFPRFVYTFGGEAGVYMAAVLSIILWLGSFIKPLCTIIVFISVFLSIFIFRVVLRKPSANLWGYLITVTLLCATNLLHALILKIGVSLPNIGLSTLGCLIFMIIGQVAYLLVLAYVTGISLKDWSNLGLVEYQKEANNIKSKFSKDDSGALLSGKLKHHDNNWDYYNDLVDQHRKRNKS